MIKKVVKTAAECHPMQKQACKIVWPHLLYLLDVSLPVFWLFPKVKMIVHSKQFESIQDIKLPSRMLTTWNMTFRTSKNSKNGWGYTSAAQHQPGNKQTSNNNNNPQEWRTNHVPSKGEYLWGH